MGTVFRFPLLLTLVLCSLFIEIAHGAPVITIINSLPKDSPPLNMKCKTNVTVIDIEHPVNAGEVYIRNAETNDLYHCLAMWGRYFTEFEAFDPKRDAGHDKIIWKAEKDGFFLSYDYGQVDFDALEQLENPDIHVDSVRTMNLFRKIKEVLAALDCPKKFILRDLIKPDADRTKLFLSALLNFCIHREDYGQVDFDALEQLENPDLHVESVWTMNLFRKIKEVLAALDCPKKFILRDLIKPNADRTELFLSALLNFCIHREDYGQVDFDALEKLENPDLQWT
ncbi:hypothetical protein RHSIM_Rhsim09G0049000 [Rhododendron simsii]|uniref:Kinetochore protein Nuf2 N-terminal domain-containing protein n=1 Tax=Rhododendron simsii TaxID=118357 RepID=A0A834LE02_RHOSS|nr:hypothetical protein RHSIM_Rhsim09G0049000 [Rhododendron simsii]